mmetsp:Transcript_37695/g.57734  ORF Transcript_37695/g.57734 Transcript_37695/m.57734 type:complete len:89 (-) Transcript_37695:1095-1361(-)
MTLNSLDVPRVEIKNPLSLRSTTLTKEQQIWGVKTVNNEAKKYFSSLREWMPEEHGSKMFETMFHSVHGEMLEEYNNSKNQKDYKFMT